MSMLERGFICPECSTKIDVAPGQTRVTCPSCHSSVPVAPEVEGITVTPPLSEKKLGEDNEEDRDYWN